MSDSNWSKLDKAAGGLIVVILAMAWCALPPAVQNPSHYGAASKQIHKAREDASAFLQEANKPDSYNPPCHQGQEDRQSDLCAQWKAADAAASAAEAGWRFGTIGTVIGLMTLVAAGAAAKFARDAASEANRNANEAAKGVKAARAAIRSSRKTAKEQDRPHVVFNDFKIDGFRNYAEGTTAAKSKFIVKFSNYGNRPAKIIFIAIGYSVGIKPSVKSKTLPRQRSGAILPRGAVLDKGVKRSVLDIAVEDAKRVVDGERLYVFGKLKYFDIGRGKHLYGFCVVHEYEAPDKAPISYTIDVPGVTSYT